VPLPRRKAKSSPRAKVEARGRRDPLKTYREKRDFRRTAEPEPRLQPGAGWQFVVQKHAARRLHYDLRLELDRVLKSWAVTRGPSLVPGEKRLAVRTEDHPMDYLEFEGNIPKGEYGGGSVIVWDRGRWTPVGDPHAGLKKGHLEFQLDGERLKGRWHLVRMRPRPGEKKEQWLLFKARDEYARETSDPAIVEEATTSSLTGRKIEDVAAADELRRDHAERAEVARDRKAELPDPARLPGAKKGMLPVFVEPSLAQLADRPPKGKDWIHEVKFDGYRIEARIDGRGIKLLTRKGLDWTDRFKPIADTLKKLRLGSALIDGEIVVETASGVPSFSELQQALSSGRKDRFIYYVFDLLYCNGADLRNVPLIERKTLLQRILEPIADSANVRFSEHFESDGASLLAHACRMGLEGIVSKRRNQPYRSGRGEHWIKSKCVERQEFVISGYVPSTVAKGSIGSLVAGYYEDGKLAYAGRVGTGFSASVARSLRQQLEKIKAPKLDFAKPLPAGAEKGVIWVEPRLVAEVEFRGWTHDDVLRQASFKGLREDKPPEEVVREKPRGSTTKNTKSESAGPSDVLGRFRLTHPERILWEGQGVTKQGLAEFYVDIADWILPHIVARPLSLVRCPTGAMHQCFFAKHAWAGLAKAIRLVDVGEPKPMLAIDDLEGLIGLVQAGVLEIHPWGSRVEDLDHPDRLIFDLDPGEGVAWEAVVSGAAEIRQRLRDLGLESFVKTSGGKGLHVMLPIVPEFDWDRVKAFTKTVSDAMAADAPDRYVATMSKQLRRGKIYVDYLRNGRGATAVAAYSTRALSGAPVSTPLEWQELSPVIRPDHFNIDNLRQRLAFLKRDSWQGFFEIRQHLPQSAVPAAGKKSRRRRS
jgi:bifunctional non-homologous end joining protein LigD